MSKLELTFLGTGTSGGVPEVGCSCDVCKSSDPRDKRLRCSSYITYKDTCVLIDTSIDLRQQLIREGISKVDAAFITHAHADHVLGLGDLRSICFRQKAPIELFASYDDFCELKKVFSYVFSTPKQRGGGVVSVIPHELNFLPFYFKDLYIEPLHVKHGILDIVGYKILNKLVYITDASFIGDDVLEKLKGVDTLILNALRKKPHATHFCLDQSLDIVKKVSPKQAFFIHMTHNDTHEEMSKDLPNNIILAYDGLKISIDI